MASRPFEYLKSTRQPALVVNGGKDVIIYSVNSFILQQNLPNAQLILYPDSSHGSQYQYPALFVKHVTLFLEGCIATGATRFYLQPCDATIHAIAEHGRWSLVRHGNHAR